MDLVAEITKIQSELCIPNYMLCNTLNITSQQLREFKSGRFELSTYSIIMFIDAYERPLYSINDDME